LSGRDINNIRGIALAMDRALDEANRGRDYRAPVCSTFFRVRFWKKGTMHIEFLDEDLWRELNIRAAQGKNWVGAGY
jgi:hypothetical protein